jgi:hypothetical protein
VAVVVITLALSSVSPEHKNVDKNVLIKYIVEEINDGMKSWIKDRKRVILNILES